MSTFPRAWAIGVINKMQDYFEARFENTFKKRFGESDQQYIDRLVNTTCEILDGVTAEQIKVGLATMKTAKFCPVMPEFKNWCLGGSDNAILASYRKKSASLANIEAWLIDDTTIITNAEREAYNRSYVMFNNLRWNYSDNQRFHTYEAFKDFYTEVVKEFVKNGIAQCDWTPPPAIADTKDDVKNKAEQKVQSDDEKNISQRLQELVAGGMSIGDASRLVMKEKYKK